MKSFIGLLLLACVPASLAGETESFWVGGGFFNDPVSWNGPPPDETVTCIFDGVVPAPFVFIDEDSVSGRLIIRDSDVVFTMWDFDPKGGYHSHHYDTVNPSFNTPSVIVAENTGEVATLNIHSGFVAAQSLILGMAAGSDGELDFSSGLFGLSAGLSCVYELHVGGAGQGLLTIDNGVVVTAGETVLGASTGSFGDVIVTNPDSRLDAAGPLIVGK